MNLNICLPPLIPLTLALWSGLGISTSLWSQNWTWGQTFGGPGSEEVTALAASGQSLWLGGSYDTPFFWQQYEFPTPAGRDLFLGQCSDSGTIQWMQTIGSAQDDALAAVAVNAAGEALWLGTFWEELHWGDSILTAPNNGQALFLAKTAPSGALEQHWIIAGTAAIKAVDLFWQNEEVFLLGTFSGTLNVAEIELDATATRAAFILKLHEENGWQWGQKIDGQGSIDPRQLAVSESGIYAVGAFNEALQSPVAELVAETWDWDGFVAAFSDSGNWQWGQKVGAQYDDYLEQIVVNPNGRLLIIGTFLGVLNTENGWSVQTPGFNTNLVWLEMDPAGNPLKLSTWGDLASEAGSGMASYLSGALITGRMGNALTLGTLPIAGQTDQANAFLAGLSTDGRANWGLAFSSQNQLLPSQIAVSPDGHIFLAGASQGDLMLDETYPSQGQFDGFVARLHPTVLPVSKMPLANLVKIAPNPSAGLFFVEAPVGARYRLFNQQGQVLETGVFQQEKALFQTDPGIYFLEVAWQGRIHLEQVVIQ